MEIVSTMGSGDLGCELDLNEVVSSLKDSSNGIESSKFSSSSMVTIRFKENGPAISFYRTGNFQIRGARNIEKSHQAKDEFYGALRAIGVSLNEPSFEVKTAVFMDELGHAVDLEKISEILGLNNIEYEPEQFPGLIFRPDEGQTTLSIFSSGKVIILGTTEFVVARQVFKQLSEMIGKSMTE